MSEEYKDLPPDQAAFEIALDENPANWSMRLRYAEFLAGRGMMEYAICQRWLGMNHQCPLFYQDQWHFGSCVNPDARPGDSQWVGHRVPQELASRRTEQESWYGRSNRRDLELFLASDLAKVGFAIDIPMKIPPDED